MVRDSSANNGWAVNRRSYGANLLNGSATAELAQWLGGSLPAGLTPSQAYTGPPRLVARAVRSSVPTPADAPLFLGCSSHSHLLMHRDFAMKETVINSLNF